MAFPERSDNQCDLDDLAEAIEVYMARGWTDGLPVVPPTERSIRAMLDAAGLEPEREIVFIENRQVSVVAQKVAINAVMAGCRPEAMPVIVAALEALADPRYGYHGPATSTGGSAVLILVNGPKRVRGLSGGRLADIAPTLLSLLGLPQPAEMTGRSLLVEEGARHAAAE